MQAKITYIPNQFINGTKFIREIDPHICPSGEIKRQAVFECKFCGDKFATQIASIKNGYTQSCGCYNLMLIKDRFTKHGYNRKNNQHPLYKTWAGMKDRCYNKKNKCYKDYGGRGITVCPEWLNNPKAFIEWALKNDYAQGLQIDRIDNNGNYEPDNCRFVSSAENNRNRRTTKLNWDKVREIRNIKNLIPNITQRELGGAYNISPRAIGYILQNKLWVEQ